MLLEDGGERAADLTQLSKVTRLDVIQIVSLEISSVTSRT